MGLFERKKSIIQTGILKGATDRHSHILYGVDDGVATLEESLQCLAFYEHEGLSDLWLTPHIMEDIPNSTERLKNRYQDLVKAYVPEGESFSGKVRLHLASEYMLDNEFSRRLESGDLLTMEDNMVLVETSALAAPVGLYEILDSIKSKGYRPLLAHVERYNYMTPRDYDRLHEMGVRMQLNLASLTGGYGPGSFERSKIILERGYYDYMGSDCHRFRNISHNYNKALFKKAMIQQIDKLLHNND